MYSKFCWEGSVKDLQIVSVCFYSDFKSKQMDKVFLHSELICFCYFPFHTFISPSSYIIPNPFPLLSCFLYLCNLFPPPSDLFLASLCPLLNPPTFCLHLSRSSRSPTLFLFCLFSNLFACFSFWFHHSLLA